MNNPQLLRGLFLFGCLANFIHLKIIERRFFSISEDPTTNRFLIEKTYTEMRRLQERITYGKELTKHQHDTLGKLQEINISDSDSQLLFIGGRVNRDGSIKQKSLKETLLAFIFIIEAIIVIPFLIGLSVELFSIPGRIELKIAATTPILLTCLTSLIINRQLLLNPYLIFIRKKGIFLTLPEDKK
ncbi:MAG: hypothetical protein VX379_10795 [Pseudomonadota bacterium]|uniref:hypothetical protein n=1 Tax=Alcanivorax sp. TaxID=1872427 RepID=UPI000C42FC9D|nr:hypothetical protein [Alcanivorax sp.]MBU86327.1 hypothetical protein [Alcanivorax sp.]MED5240054.1 hypothetical protein [Pseudomonadota bacterium]MEE3320923.1 hypothetical protein [Pseudomonadota bacterium]|tara:strand:+ start:678 stop:1235 length:558 start_codon:yes stop_codon:yes gene_type:complete